MKEITEEQINEAARKLSNITHNRLIDSEERYYKDYQKYDGIIIGAKWMQSQQLGWISVKDALPEIGQYVLVYATGGRNVTALFNPRFGKKCFYSYDLFSEELSSVEQPTHWMPLPPPPKL